jgi:hypothetical protein
MVIKAVRQNVVSHPFELPRYRLGDHKASKEAPYEYEELQRCSVEKVIKGK